MYQNIAYCLITSRIVFFSWKVIKLHCYKYVIISCEILTETNLFFKANVFCT